jgi:flagellar basal body-associated protein FliL
MTLTIPTVIWLVAVIALGGLAIYRKFVSRSEVDVLHLRQSESSQVFQQEAFAHRLATIDRWGKLLTIILIVYAALLACGYSYLAWRGSDQFTG